MDEILKGNPLLRETVETARVRPVRVTVPNAAKGREFKNAIFAMFGYFPIRLKVVTPK